MTFKRSIHELQAIVAATDLFFSERCIDPALRLPVDLSIEELFVNMVKYNRGTHHDITLRMDWIGDAVEVSLTDYDVEPYDPTRAPELDIDAPLAARRPGGMGLYLVSKMVDAIHYEYRNRNHHGFRSQQQKRTHTGSHSFAAVKAQPDRKHMPTDCRQGGCEGEVALTRKESRHGRDRQESLGCIENQSENSK